MSLAEKLQAAADADLTNRADLLREAAGMLEQAHLILDGLELPDTYGVDGWLRDYEGGA